jgi:hypothetical protein
MLSAATGAAATGAQIAEAIASYERRRAGAGPDRLGLTGSARLPHSPGCFLEEPNARQPRKHQSRREIGQDGQRGR